jgi:SAM-dependent methyltransferase
MSAGPSSRSRPAPWIPARDDAKELAHFRRAQRFLDLLSTIGVTVRGRRVADLGTGYGSIAIECARAGAANVVALDADAERVAEVQGRARTAGVLVDTRQANLLSPPADVSTADVAFLIGVVEYAGLWDEGQPVRALQRRVVSTAHAALREGGTLVFGTKNRLWPRFVIDDVHTHLPFVNVLPRGAADRVSRALTDGPYRHHLHSPGGWAKLVTEAGFREVRLYVPYFSYQLPILITERPSLRLVTTVGTMHLAPEDDAAARGSLWLIKALLMGVAGHLRLPLSHSVLVIARK